LKKDAKENYFLDRDGALFKYVLDFLRDDVFKKPTDEVEEAFLRAEFEYFGLPYPGSPSSSQSKPSGTWYE
jgi:BTB/POZ domain-containing protein KCTD8/12/16